MPDMHKSIEIVLKIKTVQIWPIPLDAVADIKISDGPPMINSEMPCCVGAVLMLGIVI
jgi:Cu(I)/Ag(I) efflux system membrane protein CusA/SilA